jgi:hypothetical protein
MINYFTQMSRKTWEPFYPLPHCMDLFFIKEPSAATGIPVAQLIQTITGGIPTPKTCSII